jgi:hypothetical protein
MFRRSRSSPRLPADRVIWSASEYLVVEGPVDTQQPRPAVRWIGPLAAIAACAAVLVYFFAEPPRPTLVSVGAARTPAGWLSRYSDRIHRHLELMATTEYAGRVAYLQVSTGPHQNHQMLITLYKRDGLWEAEQEQQTGRGPAR